MSRFITAARSGAANRLLAASALALLALALAAPPATLAHERRTVAGYDLVVGFAAEPALEGEKNGLSLRVSKDGKPVEGVEKTLKWEITHVQSKATKAYPIRAVFNTPGSYTSDMIPTLSGQYRFRFSGTINGAAIDATFESGPGTFNNVEPVKDLQFPVAAAQPRELEGAVRGATEAAQAAADAAGSARTMAFAGVGLGAAGLATGLAGLLAARRARS